MLLEYYSHMKKQTYIAQNLKFLRTREKIKTKYLSNELGISISTLFNLEKNGINAKPSFDLVETISDYFSLSIELFCYADLSKLNEQQLMVNTIKNNLYGVDLEIIYPLIQIEIQKLRSDVKTRKFLNSDKNRQYKT